MSNLLNFDLNKEVTSNLKFKVDPERDNGLVVGIIEKVLIDEYIPEPNPKNPGYEYVGMNVPRLIMRFRQVEHGDDFERFETLMFQPVISIKNDGGILSTKDRSDIYTTQLSKIIHIADVFQGLPNAVKKNTLKLPNVSMESTGQTHLDEVKALYEELLKLFYTVDGNEIYKDVKTIFKLIINKDAKTTSFPSYINDGFISSYKRDGKGKLVTPITIKSNESIVYVPNKNATPAGAAMPAMGDMDLTNV